MQQMTLFDGTWISGDAAMPAPGQRVLEIYETVDGTPSRPVLGTPILKRGAHLKPDGTSIYRKTIWWMPIPPMPSGGLHESVNR